MSDSDNVQVVKFPAIASVIMLLLALLEGWPYGYYTLLRFVVCGSSAHLAFTAHQMNKKAWVWVMAFIAILFNPIVPIHLDRTSWAPIDLATAFLFLIALFVVKSKKSGIGQCEGGEPQEMKELKEVKDV
jgi:hypothetical protein